MKNLAGFMEGLQAIRTGIDAEAGRADIRHVQRIDFLSRAFTGIGFVLAAFGHYLLAIPFISQGRFLRWQIAHHVMHKGYDQIPGVPARFHSSRFARGLKRRFLDWFDWIYPESWVIEHNRLHHYSLLEDQDPSGVENAAENLPFKNPVLRGLMLFNLLFHWRMSAYIITAMKQLFRQQERLKPAGEVAMFSKDLPLVSPFNRRGLEIWLKCWLPYPLFHFVLVPSLFLLISREAALSVLIASILAEIFYNFHSGMTIYPNHAGPDLYRFDLPVRDRQEFYLRQILGSANYRCGGDFNDMMHGWLNYQIEHHIWPNLTMRQYQIVQPRVKALCAAHDIPYAQENIFKRLKKSFAVFMGLASMQRYPSVEALTSANPD